MEFLLGRRSSGSDLMVVVLLARPATLYSCFPDPIRRRAIRRLRLLLELPATVSLGRSAGW